MSVGYDAQNLILAAFAGLNTHAAPEVRPGGMRPNQARLLENMDTSEGDLQNRKGHKRVRVAKVDGSRPILAAFRALKGSTGYKVTIVQTRNKLWTLSASAVASIQGSAVSLTSGYPVVLCSYQDAVYGVNNQDATFFKWTFTGKLASATGPATGPWKIVFPFEEKIVHARDTTRAKFAWSDEGAPETYQTLHFAFYPADRSEDLILAWPLNGEIIFASPTRTGKTVGGLPPRAIVDIDAGHGCVSFYSMAVLNGWMYWVAAGPVVVRTNGNVVQEVSGDLDLTDVSVATERMLRGAAYMNRYYVLSYRSVAAGAAFPDRQLVYDSLTGEWRGGPHKQNRVTAWSEWRAPGDDGRLFGGSPSGFAAYYYSGSSDAGTRITGVYEGPVFRGANPLYRVAFDEMGVATDQLTSGTATLKLYIDRQTTASTVGTVNMKASGAVEGDRDTTTVTRTTIFGPKKPKQNQTCFAYQPQLSLAQKSGRARATMLWIASRQVKEE